MIEDGPPALSPPTPDEAMSAGVAAAPAPPRSRKALHLGIQLLVVAGAGWMIWRVLREVSWAEMVTRLKGADPWFTLLALTLLVGRYTLWDLRWRLAYAHVAQPPHPVHTYFQLMAAICANALTPTLKVIGGILRARYTSPPGEHGFGRAYGVVFFDQLVHSTVLGITGWMTFAGLAFIFGEPGLASVSLLALIATLAIYGRAVQHFAGDGGGKLGAVFTRRMEGRGEGVMRSVYRHGHEALAVARRLLGESRLRRGVLACSIAYMLLNSLAQWAVFRAIHAPVDVLAVILAVTAGMAAGTFTGTPGGIGTTEAGMVLVYVALEIPRVEAGAGTVLYRGLHYAVIFALGLPALAMFELRQRRSGLPAAEERS